MDIPQNPYPQPCYVAIAASLRRSRRDVSPPRICSLLVGATWQRDSDLSSSPSPSASGDSVSCVDNRFNDDRIENNGCVMGCRTVVAGSCETCSSSLECTRATFDDHRFNDYGNAGVTCDDSRFNDDGIENNSRETGWFTIAPGSCET